MRQRIRSGILVAFMAGAAWGQAAFEVASVKVNQLGKSGGEGSRRENLQVSPGTVTMRNLSLRSTIRWAYHVFDYQITGPDWLGSERYDIIAKAKGPATEEEMRPMMQALLAERFKLTLHRQTKEVSAYVLVVAKGGPKFKESPGEGDPLLEPNQKTMSFSAKRVPISFMIDHLSDLFHAPIVDMTGLKGHYEVTIDVAKYMAEMQSHGDVPPDPQALIVRGLQDELGLKLEPKKTSVDLLIIDGAEKLPVEQ
jgi:uncharacterized protein (TIGR03435 family)